MSCPVHEDTGRFAPDGLFEVPDATPSGAAFRIPSQFDDPKGQFRGECTFGGAAREDAFSYLRSIGGGGASTAPGAASWCGRRAASIEEDRVISFLRRRHAGVVRVQAVEGRDRRAWSLAGAAAARARSATKPGIRRSFPPRRRSAPSQAPSSTRRRKEEVWTRRCARSERGRGPRVLAPRGYFSDESRQRRGCDVDSPRRRVAARLRSG